jgi:hypothetical protein
MKIKNVILFWFLFIGAAGAGDFVTLDNAFHFSKRSYIENSELNVGYFVSCQTMGHNYCQALCGAMTCLVNNDSCDGCVSSTNLNVFAVFNDFSKLFVLNESAPNWSLVFQRFQAGTLRVIDENAMLNLFEDTQSDEKYENARKQFLGSCPMETQKAFLVVDENINPVLYVCQGTYGQKVYQTQWNPEFTP